MANLLRSKAGQYAVRFQSIERETITIPLGKLSKANAKNALGHIEELISSKEVAGTPEAATRAWLRKTSIELRYRLYDAGLLSSINNPTLGEYLEIYLEERRRDPNLKKTSYDADLPATNSILKFLGSEIRMGDITRADAKSWRIDIGQSRKENTVRKWVQVAKKIFNSAIAAELIDRNPFQGMASQPVQNRSRDYYVTPEESVRVLRACPNAEWRAIFSLARYGGLRCPSEVMALRWDDIQWEQNRFLVPSSKTEHHAGHDCRTVPMWPEVRLALEDLCKELLSCEGYIIQETRIGATSLRQIMVSHIERAGIKPWPKPFQNMRATRATEISNRFGESRESMWIGHSRRIAKKHYLMSRACDFEQAASFYTDESI